MKVLLLDPEYQSTPQAAHHLLMSTLESAGLSPKDCYIGLDETAVTKVQPELIVCLGVPGARLLYGKGTKSEVRVPNGVGKKGQDLYREPNLTELRRRADLEYGVPGLMFPVQVITPPASALARTSIMPGFVRDCQQVAERVGARAEVDQSRDYFECDDTDRYLALSSGEMQGATIALDTEFDQEGNLYCYSFSWREGVAGVVFAGTDGAQTFLIDLMDDAGKLVLHNCKADVPVICRWLGWETEDWRWDKTEDTICQAYCLGYKPLSLKSLSETQLGLRVIRLEEITDGDYDLSTAPRDELVKYAAADADLTLRLWNKFTAELLSA